MVFNHSGLPIREMRVSGSNFVLDTFLRREGWEVLETASASSLASCCGRLVVSLNVAARPLIAKPDARWNAKKLETSAWKRFLDNIGNHEISSYSSRF